MPYPEEMVAPLRRELDVAGVRELKTPVEVDAFMAQKPGSALVFINSVCGCAAGSARPGLRLALTGAKAPQRRASVFAGQDLDAVARMRGYFGDIPPSSPSIALFKDGELVHFVPRHLLEGRAPEQIAIDLMRVFEEYC